MGYISLRMFEVCSTNTDTQCRNDGNRLVAPEIEGSELDFSEEDFSAEDLLEEDFAEDFPEDLSEEDVAGIN